MFFRKKPKRLYYPTSTRWYTQPRKMPGLKSSRKVFTHNIRTHFTRLFKNAFYFTISAVILFVMITILFFSSYLSITNIEVVRKDFNINTAVISNELNQYIGNNIMFFRKADIRDTIQKKFPEFAIVEVNKIFPHTIKIQLESYPTVANLRAYYILPKAEVPAPTNEDKSMAKIEKALETAMTLEGTPDEEETVTKEELTPIEQKCLLNRIGQAIFDQEENLELITVSVGTLEQPIEDRELVVPKEVMDYILDSMRYFNNTFKMQVAFVKYLPVAREVRFKTDTNIWIWLSLEKDYKNQIDKLQTIYETAELDKEEIRYIDLRVSEKVIYCPLNARCNKLAD